MTGHRTGVLVLHGLTGSPWEVRPVADALVARGCSVALPVLAGHATSVHALAETGWRDWLTSARTALTWLEERCDRVSLVGLSMGALVSLLLAQERPRRLAAVALLAPALTLGPAQRLAVLAAARLGWPAVVGKEDPRLAGGLRPPCYHAVPLRSAAQLLELMEVVRSTVRPLPVPSLVLHGTRDLTIPHDPTLRHARAILGPQARLESIAGAGHLLPRTAAGSDVVARVVGFLHGHGALDE